MIVLKLQNLVNHRINKVLICIELISVGVAGFEPATSSSQTRRDDRATLHPEINDCKCTTNLFILQTLIYVFLNLDFTKNIAYFCSKKLFMLIIGITGGTGSGKTTVVKELLTDLSEQDISVISQDSYYKDTSDLTYEERTEINFDHPESIDFDLLIEQLTALKEGKTIQQPVYSFVEHNRVNKTIATSPKKVIIVEGILIFNNPVLRDLFNIKIYVHADSDERLIRRIKRDITERGRDLTEVLDRYLDTLKPMHKQFIESTKKYADIIIPNNKFNTVGINIVKTIINEKLS